MEPDEAPVDHRVDQDIEDRGRLVDADTGPEATDLDDPADNLARPVAALHVVGGQQRRHVGIRIGCDDEHEVQGRDPLVDGRVHGDPRVEHLDGVVRPHEPLHHRDHVLEVAASPRN